MFDPDHHYTPSELSAMADEMLREDSKTVDPDTGKQKGIKGKDAIIFKGLGNRHDDAREILNPNGVPEANLAKISGTGRRHNGQQPMYNRTHPEGRKVNSEIQRRTNGASWYRHHDPFPSDILFSIGDRWRNGYEELIWQD